MKRAFLIGNGISRRDIVLNSLRPYGDIFGCNALYREFTPDYLFCVDVRMIYEVAKSGFARDTLCGVFATWYDDFNTTYKNLDGIKFLDFNKERKLASGPSSLYKALEMDYDEIWLVGHDMKLRKVIPLTISMLVLVTIVTLVQSLSITKLHLLKNSRTLCWNLRARVILVSLE